jgi:hypothetical protein
VTLLFQLRLTPLAAHPISATRDRKPLCCYLKLEAITTKLMLTVWE